MTPAVSVVTPTYRRDELLGRCLERLLTQRYPPDAYEIVVADDGPCDSTRRLVESLATSNRIAVRYIPVVATQGPAGARNAGWRQARGAVVAFTDDDCLPDADWLATGVAALEAFGADAATGRTVVPLPPRPTDYERDAAGLARSEFVTANCFCRRSVLEEVGGFDEQFRAAWREDSDLHFTLLERGKVIVRADAAVVVHPVRPAAWGVSLRQQAKSAYDLLLAKKHPTLYRERIPRFPRIYLGALAGLATLVIGLAVGLPAAVLIGGVLWSVATLLFAARRLRGGDRSPRHVAEMLVTSALIPPVAAYWRVFGWIRFRPPIS